MKAAAFLLSVLSACVVNPDADRELRKPKAQDKVSPQNGVAIPPGDTGQHDMPVQRRRHHAQRHAGGEPGKPAGAA